MIPPIFDVLTSSPLVFAIVGDRIYRHGSAPQDNVKPYLTWFIVTGMPENTLSEVPKIDKIKLQIDCYSKSDSGAFELAKKVRDSIEPHAHMVDMPVDERDDQTKLYRIALEFDWFVDR